MEIDYCKCELEFYVNCSEKEKKRRCAVAFECFTETFEATMKKIYVGFLGSRDDEVPAFVLPIPVKAKKGKSVSLKKLGYSNREIMLELREYYTWMDRLYLIGTGKKSFVVDSSVFGKYVVKR